MKLIRKRDGTVILSDCSVADTAWKRMIGLLGHSNLKENQGLWIYPTNSIHTMFMRFPIDAVFLNKDGEVVAHYDSMKPWRLSKIHFRAQVVIEAAAGVFKKFGIQKGEVLEICPSL